MINGADKYSFRMREIHDEHRERIKQAPKRLKEERKKGLQQLCQAIDI
jgi:hypothetical protein